jgi:hypothetical protein
MWMSWDEATKRFDELYKAVPDVHGRHCWFGEQLYGCKYGDGDRCTATPKTWPFYTFDEDGNMGYLFEDRTFITKAVYEKLTRTLPNRAQYDTVRVNVDQAQKHAESLRYIVETAMLHSPGEPSYYGKQVIEVAEFLENLIERR